MDLRILWHSVSATIRSGYGTVTRHVTSRLRKEGIDIIVSAYYGLEPGGILYINNVPHVASKEGPFGRDSFIRYFKTLRCNVGLLHTDWWAFDWFPKSSPCSLLYSPMDHEKYNSVLMDLVRAYTKVISLCKWQYNNLKKENIESVLIPHGVDTRIFKPIAKDFVRRPDMRDKFILLMAAANSDKEPRKGWTEAFQGIKIFLENNPDAKKDLRVLIHSNAQDKRGYNLIALAKYLDLEKYIIFENPDLWKTGLSDNELALLYNSADILLNPSRREGFGLCILESMSCGVPVIGHNYSSMPELIKGRGWLCKSKAKIITPILAVTAIPDEYDIAKCIENAYNSPNKIKKFSKRCREFALQFDWEKIISKWISFLESLEIKKQIDMIGIKEAKDKKFEEIFKKVTK